MLSLFDNSILSRSQDDDGSDTTKTKTPPAPEHDRNHQPRIRHIRRALLDSFPSAATLDRVLNVSQAWWEIGLAMFPQIYGAEPGTGFKEFVAASNASGSVQKMAKALLCIAISLQEAPPGLELDLGGSTTAVDLAAHYGNMIHDLVISDDEIAGTIDGIECLFLHSKYDINDGRVRRAWLSLRRGLSFSQLLGLHLRSKSSTSSEPAVLRGQSLWTALYQTDRFLSLLLGLPFAVSEIPCPLPGSDGAIPTDNSSASRGEQYFLKLACIVGHIIDRNQEPPSNNSLPLTIKIDGEMNELVASMPSEWWVYDATMEDEYDHMYTRLIPQFWHHQARILLHLPFMLMAATDRRYEYNKIAALESAREMIQRYRVIRPAQGFRSAVCKVIDFQIFTAAMVLVLNLMGISQTSSARDLEEAAMDEELVTITHDLLHRASLETQGGVTTQAARALKMFCKARADPCTGGDQTAKLVIPYVGTVAFGPGKSFNHAYMKCQDAVQQPGQVPTPESLDDSLQDPSGFNNFLATIPTDLNFGGYQLQQPPDAGMNGEVFANIYSDLDQDWSWFWNNTNMT